MTRIKVCGLTRAEDVEAAVAMGVDAVGFIFASESPRSVRGLPDVSELVALAGPYVTTVAVFGEQDAVPPLGFDRVQRASSLLAQGDKSVRVIQTVYLNADATVPVCPPWVVAFHLEPYVPGLAGGTGRTADWELAARFVAASPLPVILAGGLHAENVAEAIHTVRPYAVDVNSGIESSPGVKDHAQLETFVSAVRSIREPSRVGSVGIP